MASFHLKQTNVSQPTLQHTKSARSVAASEDYYSLSSASEHTDDRQQSEPFLPIQRFQTPPSRYRTPAQSREHLHDVSDPSPERRQSPMRGTGKRRSSSTERARRAASAMDDVPPLPLPHPLQTGRRHSPIRRKPVPSTVYEASTPSKSPINPRFSMSSAAQEISREENAPTPGMDDTPYIHFALDQLTRDEEVRGSRAYPGQRPSGGGRPKSYEILGLHDPLPTPSGPEEWHARAEELHSIAAGGYLGALDFEHYDEPIPIPQRSPRRSSVQPPTHQTPPPELFVPFDPAPDSFQQPLRFLPGILRPVSLLLYIFLLTLFLAALMFCAIWSRIHTSLWDYGSFGDGRYFVFQYLPTLFGMILLLWLFEIELAVYRIAPFIALTCDSPASRSHGPLLPMYPSGFTLPTFAHFKAGQPVIGLFLFVSWLSLFTIPLLATCFNVYYRQSWVWLATQGTIWTTIVLYVFLLVALIALFIYLRKRQTGLKWDPVSLADIIVILERSNVLDTYAQHNIHSDNAELRERLADRLDSLGYWHTSNRPNEIFHTLGAPNRPVRQYTLEDGRIREKLPPPTSRYSNINTDPESQRLSHGTYDSKAPINPLESAPSYLPWFLRPTFTILWAITAIVLLLAFLIVSYLPATAIRSGFLPDLPAPVNTAGFSSANFLYSFIPALLGLFCLLFWYSVDLAFRRLQPYASLRQSEGALAEESLLLSYPSDGLGLVSLKAAINRHFRVALLSVTTLLAATLPVLAGGVFWTQFSVEQQRVRVYGQMPAFHALTVFLVLYALSYTLIYTSKKKRGLPVEGRSVADVIALVHQSRLLADTAFRAPATKTSLVTRLLSAPDGSRVSMHDEPRIAGSKVSLADSVRGFGRARLTAVAGMGVLEEPRFAFGRYLGRDGREWIGIDRMNREGGGGVLARDV